MFLFKSSQNHDGNDPLQRDAKVKELKVALGPLSGRNAKFCTDACLRRYLEARNCNVDKAKKMVEETLKWRDAYKPEEIRWHEVAHEGETGKVSRANFHDREGRTVLIMRPGKQNTTSAEGNVRHLVYLLENAILNLPEGQEQMVWMIDYTGFSMSTSLSVRTARDIINILQNHYPERLGIAVLYNPPRIFYAFWRAVKYFLDPKTSQKVKFVYPKNKDSAELMRSYFDVENLPKEFGGIATLEYDHEEFSRMMAEDDIKASRYWGFDDKSSYAAQGCVTRDVSVQPILPSGHSKAEVAPEPF
ncbi:random slug protein 5-like [Chenopodium quinoa]|uniref:random slug protein 5-like n=1 Tax=Chenopodium quinoa TaxID=63459 RepID=UPI000B79663B|nr:random slug protein 5-like [Chenopodium quinoa]XP_021718003.1 random slug protein 5-like [Chenopodium quinoa]